MISGKVCKLSIIFLAPITNIPAVTRISSMVPKQSNPTPIAGGSSSSNPSEETLNKESKPQLRARIDQINAAGKILLVGGNKSELIARLLNYYSGLSSAA